METAGTQPRTAMQIENFLSPRRIIDLKSRDFRSALVELLALCPDSVKDDAGLLEKLLQRERTIPTHLDNSVALPHVRASIKKKFIFAVGRCPDGLPDSPDDEDKKVHILFLVLAANKEASYHPVLLTLASALEEKSVIERLENAATLRDFRSSIATVFKGVVSSATAFGTRLNQLVLREAEKIALSAKCASLLLFMDTFTGTVRIPRR